MGQYGEDDTPPVAWRIVHPSGDVVYVEHEIVESICKKERPGRVINKRSVSEVYRSSDVAPLYKQQLAAACQRRVGQPTSWVEVAHLHP